LAIAAGAAIHFEARASDHADTPAIAATPGVDLTDVFLFPSPVNPNNVVLVMNVHPLIPSGQGLSTVFDPNVLYQFKIDNTGDFKEDLVIQAKFSGTGANQKVQIAGPVKPERIGTQAVFERPDPVVGTINTTFTTSNGMTVFAGAREDPFFFDLNQFFTILPDRETPINGIPVANPDAPQATSFRAPGQAQDFLRGLNVLSIVVELPKSMLRGATTSKIGLWCTTSK
jgi:hypothetical protein